MAFKHKLNFLSLPSVGTIEIAEPIGFDGASYKVKQDDKRFGRDIIIANEDTELTFTRDYFEQIQITQILPSGEIFNYASQGFDYLLDIFQNDGWEGKVEYIIQKDDIAFTTGIFSYYTSIVEFDNIKVKIIQNTNREVLKRLEDTDIDAFNNKALDNRDIVPCETTNILLKAKPVVQSSSFKLNENRILTAGRFGNYNNFSSQIFNYGIENTLTFFTQQFFGSFNSAINTFRILYAANDLKNVTIKKELDLIFNYSTGGNGDSGSLASITLFAYVYQHPREIGDVDFWSSAVYSKTITGNSDQTFVLPTEIEFTIPSVPRGYSVSLFWSYIWDTEHIDQTTWNLQKDTNLISAISTSIDTVVKGIRLIDLIKHNVKSIVDMPVIAPEYDLGGEHYDNFAFNGLLLGQITDKPFYNQFKDLMNIPMETCSDYQINPDSIEILPYAGYYEDIELAVFDELPSYSSNSMFSKQYTLKNAEFKYNKSSSERETNAESSIDDVHTETQKFITDSVDGSLKVDIKHIRSAFLIEQARRRAFDNEQTTSLQNDDNLFLLKCIALAPSSQGGFGAVLLMQINDNGHLQILNNNTDGDGISFNWTLLGFNVGSQFFIDSGENIGTWQVLDITNSLLTLFPISVSASFQGEAYITMRWFFTDILYTNQTNETYSLIEGVANSDNYSNLDYSWGRNIQRWFPYLASATKFKPNGVIKTSSFKINGNLVTRKLSETESVSDSADILNSDIASLKILNPFNHTVKVYAPFNIVTQLIKDIRDLKGYVSVNLNDGRMIKGYVQNMDYTWITEELDLVLEEKFISDYMEIDLTVNEDLTTTTTITNPNYPTKSDLKSFQINNIFVTLYNSLENTLYPPTRFVNIKINGVQYTDIIDFSDALTELINAQNE